MLKKYQDITEVDVEEESEAYIRAEPQKDSSNRGRRSRMRDAFLFAPTTLPLSRSWMHQFCPRRRLALILLGLGSALAITATVLNANGGALSSQLQGLQAALRDANHTAAVEMAAFLSREGSTAAKTRELELSVKKMTEDIEAARQRLLAQMAFLQGIVRTVHCDLEDFQRHRTGSRVCCPPGWVTFRSSCYWESRAGKSWGAAKKDCEDKDSHLVIINSYEEQLFVAQRVRPMFTWIGLTDASGSWKWVDGTPYTVRQEDWREEQPDNWYGHGLGGGEDCAHMHDDGRWNDDHCSREYGWVCEMEASS